MCPDCWPLRGRWRGVAIPSVNCGGAASGGIGKELDVRDWIVSDRTCRLLCSTSYVIIPVIPLHNLIYVCWFPSKGFIENIFCILFYIAQPALVVGLIGSGWVGIRSDKIKNILAGLPANRVFSNVG